MFKWFKKLKNVELDSTSNLNGLYSARIADLKKLQKRIETLNNQLTELNNKVDALPPIPDHSMYARKDQTNTFTQRQTFNRGMYVNNQKIEGIGNPTENGDATHKLYVDSADSQTRNSATRYTNTKADEVKQYADTKDSQVKVEMSQLMDTKISQMDTSNFAKLDQQNNFAKSMRVKQGINVDGYLLADTTEFGSGTIQNVPNNAKSIVNKEYVDNNVGGLKLLVNRSNIFTESRSWVTTVDKLNYTGFFRYSVNSSISIDSSNLAKLTKGLYMVTIDFQRLERLDGSAWEDVSFRDYIFVSVLRNGELPITLYFKKIIISGADLIVGLNRGGVRLTVRTDWFKVAE